MEELRQSSDKLHKETETENKRKNHGRLTIFFGYAAGTGKTYRMLQAAREAARNGTDVAAGVIDTHGNLKMEELLEGIEKISKSVFVRNEIEQEEFDLDAALCRSPQLILMDELAHTNAKGCRHHKRYQDINELLQAGIDVYTTVNVQNIESLNDVVASITGITVRERIPDSVFDGADQVELVDMEPEKLLERLNMEREYKGKARKDVTGSIFTEKKLEALQKIAFRRYTDRKNILAGELGKKESENYDTDEHILVCLSSAPSNEKIIRTAARMAQAFGGSFSAVFVETPDFSAMSPEDKKRLQENIRLAEQFGARIETVYGEDIPYQIAEFARISGVSKIVIGRSMATRRNIFSKPALTEMLIAYAPNIDIHIIPDMIGKSIYREKKKREWLIFSALDILKCVAALVVTTGLGILFQRLGFTEANIITIYILSVLIISVITTNRVYSLLSSLASVIIFNFFFTEPKYTLLAYDQGYPVTFLVMFLAALITGTLAAKLKNHARQSAQIAYRTKLLFDTDVLLGKAKGSEAIIDVASHQLVKLFERDVVVYPAKEGRLGEPQVFFASDKKEMEQYLGENEQNVAAWVFRNNKHAGATTDTFSNAQCLYLAIRINENVYGVVGIAVHEQPLDVFEKSVLLSILGECALALENDKNAREKEKAAVIAKNEQLRANLLRSISHDLRTPLTSISGNASNLLSNGGSFDEETKQRLYSDIYDDSMWLINLVENLLAVTRIEEGRMNLRLSAELVDEVIAEALRHVNRKSIEHNITVHNTDELLLAKIDARLIVQVVINIVDNAIKYTPKDSEIEINAWKKGTHIVVTISDNGPGISDKDKEHIFDMFYSGKNKIADSRRSLGLGLSLCKSIITAHGGEITVSDHEPHGTVFTFTLPAEEVELHE